MTDVESLFLAVRAADVRDDQPWLIMADALDEAGLNVAAEMIRVMCVAYGPRPVEPKRPNAWGLIARIAFPVGGALWAQARLDRYKQELSDWQTARTRYGACHFRFRAISREGIEELRRATPGDTGRLAEYFVRHLGVRLMWLGRPG